jgi:hypothetical protein
MYGYDRQPVSTVPESLIQELRVVLIVAEDVSVWICMLGVFTSGSASAKISVRGVGLVNVGRDRNAN